MTRRGQGGACFCGQRFYWSELLALGPQSSKGFLLQLSACPCYCLVVEWLLQTYRAIIGMGRAYSVSRREQPDCPGDLPICQRDFPQPFQARGQRPLQPGDDPASLQPGNAFLVVRARLDQVPLSQRQMAQSTVRPRAIILAFQFSTERERLLQQCVCGQLVPKREQFIGIQDQGLHEDKWSA